MTTVYRQDPNMFRVCVNCHKARDHHTWSEKLQELLCTEPPSLEVQVEVLLYALHKLVKSAERVHDAAAGDIYTDAPECAGAVEDLNEALGELDTAIDEGKALVHVSIEFAYPGEGHDASH